MARKILNKAAVWVEYRLQRLVRSLTGFPGDRVRAKCYSVDKSVFFRTQQALGYDYGRDFRDPNPPDLDKGILKENEYFETIEQRDIMGVVSIHVDDLLIAGRGICINYISKTLKAKSRRIAMGKTNRPIRVWKSQIRTMRSLQA